MTRLTLNLTDETAGMVRKKVKALKRKDERMTLSRYVEELLIRDQKKKRGSEQESPTK